MRQGDAVDGVFLDPRAGSGVWRCFDFDVDVWARLRQQVHGRDDLSINVLELLLIGIDGCHSMDVYNVGEHAA